MKTRYTIAFLCLLTCSQSFALEKILTLKEVQSHNVENDCWIIVDNKVYDITKFIKAHELKCDNIELSSFCGKDASTIWRKKEKSEHTHKRKSVLNFQRSQVGVLNNLKQKKQ